jgi:hypothetical protein
VTPKPLLRPSSRTASTVAPAAPAASTSTSNAFCGPGCGVGCGVVVAGGLGVDGRRTFTRREENRQAPSAHVRT